MSRYIDADDLEKAIYKWMPKDQETWMDSEITPIENLVVSIMMTIEEQPTVDMLSCDGCRYEQFGNHRCYSCTRNFADRYERKEE